MVADLRRARGRYPNDPRLTALVQSRLSGNERFSHLWHEGTVANHREEHDRNATPEAGEIAVWCDVLSDAKNDLKIVVYYPVTPGSPDGHRVQSA